MPLSGSQFVISAGAHEVTIAEVGASLRSFTVGGVDVTVPYGEDVLAPRGCGAVLVPWPNRLRGGTYRFEGRMLQVPITEPDKGCATHGLGRWTRWTAVRHEPSTVTMSLDLVPQSGWPFEVRVDVTYALDPNYGLSVTAVAHNHGTGRAPFGAGFHPYLALRGAGLNAVSLHLPAASRLVMDDAQLPIGVQPVGGTPYDFHVPRQLGPMRMDDEFTGLATVDGRGAVDVTTPGGGTRLWFEETFRYLQVFTIEELPNTGQPGIAIEPMTCAADAFNSGNGLIVLEPGGTWTGAWGIAPL
jgi:aldose 1-epimerase